MRIIRGLTTGMGGIVLLVAAVAAQTASPAERLLQEGLLLERAEGKIGEAIVRFERVVAEFPNDTDVMPRALFHLGRAYQDRQDPRASSIFTRLVNGFPSAVLAQDARERVAALERADAGPFRMRALGFLGSAVPYPSPDGRQVLYARPVRVAGRLAALGLGAALDSIIEEVVGPSKLVLHDLGTGKETDLGAQAGIYRGVEWSPDSKRVLVVYTQSPTNVAELVALEIQPAWKTQIITLSTRKIDTLSLPQFSAYAWSPDSQRIASAPVAVKGTLSEVHLTTIASNQTRTIGATDGPAEFVWSPDGTRLAFHMTDASNRVDEVRLVTVATGQTQSLKVPPATDGARSKLGAQSLVKWNMQDELVYRVELPKVGGDIYLLPVSGAPGRKVCEARIVSSGTGCSSMTADGSGFLGRNAAATRLMWRDVATGRDLPVTSSSGEELANWFTSPDLSVAGFVSNRDGRRWGVYVAPLGGGTVDRPVRLTWLDGQPSSLRLHGWAPNGQVVLGIRWAQSDVYRLDVDRQSGRPRGIPDRLTQDTTDNLSPAMSPDRSRIAYWYRSGTKSGLAVMDASGANERPVLERAVPAGAPALGWLSSDEVVYLESAPGGGQPAGLAALNVKSGLVRMLPHGQISREQAFGGWALAPSRQELVYLPPAAGTSDDGWPRQIKARSLADGAERTIATEQPILSFAVSPDGSQIVYATGDEAALAELEKSFEALIEGDAKVAAALMLRTTQCEIRIVDADGSERRLLRSEMISIAALEGGCFRFFGFSPDGRFLLFELYTQGVRILDIGTGNHWPLFDTPASGTRRNSPTWAADGSILLRGSENRTEYKVWDGVTREAVVKLADGGR